MSVHLSTPKGQQSYTTYKSLYAKFMLVIKVMWFGIGKMCLEKNMIRILTCIINVRTVYLKQI